MSNTAKEMLTVAILGSVIMESIPENDFIPNGPTYAAMMQFGITLDQYKSLLRILEQLQAITATDETIRRGAKYGHVLSQFNQVQTIAKERGFKL